ncbi:MAG: hypothetical protein LOY03_05970 [Cyclobacteriaceae bacterium]|nr:hypothetical protein [Cyclobacteriaceae bacterium]
MKESQKTTPRYTFSVDSKHEATTKSKSMAISSESRYRQPLHFCPSAITKDRPFVDQLQRTLPGVKMQTRRVVGVVFV